MGLLVAVVRAGVEMTMEGAQQAGRNGAVLGPQSWKGSSGRGQGTQAGLEGRSEKHVAQICVGSMQPHSEHESWPAPPAQSLTSAQTPGLF